VKGFIKRPVRRVWEGYGETQKMKLDSLVGNSGTPLPPQGQKEVRGYQDEERRPVWRKPCDTAEICGCSNTLDGNLGMNVSVLHIPLAFLSLPRLSFG
jgi:hypothetical protein